MMYSSSLLRITLCIFLTRLRLILAFQRPFTNNVSNSRRQSNQSNHRALVFDEIAGTSSIISSIDTFYRTEPYIAAFVTCSAKASAADFLAQKKQTDANDNDDIISTSAAVQERNNDYEPVDLKRNVAFLFYGGLYQGVAQEYLFVHWFPTLFGKMDDPILSVAMQVCFDNFIIAPFLCLPVFYVARSFIPTIGNDNNLVVGIEERIRKAFDSYWNDVTYEQLLFKYWLLWIPVQTLTFGVVPEHYRVTFVAIISFVWIIILSSISSKVR